MSEHEYGKGRLDDAQTIVAMHKRIAALEAEIESDNKTIELLKAENEELRKALKLVMCYPDIRIYIGSELSGIADAAMKDAP